MGGINRNGRVATPESEPIQHKGCFLYNHVTGTLQIGSDKLTSGKALKIIFVKFGKVPSRLCRLKGKKF